MFDNITSNKISIVNNTYYYRERKVISAENYAKYRAHKLRWKEMLKTYTDSLNHEQAPSVPIYIRECQQHEKFNSQESSASSIRDDIDENQLMFLDMTAKVS